jgi:hypothetical protein
LICVAAFVGTVVALSRLELAPAGASFGLLTILAGGALAERWWLWVSWGREQERLRAFIVEALGAR